MKQLSSPKKWLGWLFLILVVFLLYFLVADHLTPMTNDAYVRAYVVQVTPQVSGHVTEVTVKNNQEVKAGQPLLKIFQPPYFYALEQAKAKLVATRDKVSGLRDEIAKTQALIEQRKANLDVAQKHYLEYSQLAKSGFVSHSRMLDITKSVADDKAALTTAEQALAQARQNLGSQVDGENVHILHAKAALAVAQINYKNTIVRAAHAGQVVNLHTETGNYAQVGSVQMAIVTDNSWWVQANVKENNLARIKLGQKALVSLAMYPGRLFNATVVGIGGGINLAQDIPNNYLPYIKKTHNWVRLSQRFPIELKLVNWPKHVPLRVGASANVTILSSSNFFWRGTAYAWQWVRSAASYLS